MVQRGSKCRLRSVDGLYTVVSGMTDARRKLVRQILDGRATDEKLVDRLRCGLELLLATSDKSQRAGLEAAGGISIEVSLDFEIKTLKYDLMFLEYGRDEFLEFLAQSIPGAERRVRMAQDMFPPDKNFNCWLTDRDGTIIDYCERYRSCVQPLYNAVILSEFAAKHTECSIILTSGPLEPDGVLSLATVPEKAFVHAGSKGREYADTSGERKALPINPRKQEVLDRLNSALTHLVQSENQVFGLIGSGLQFKFGQTTVARQDKHHSVPVRDSERFLRQVEEVVRTIDPEGRDLRLEDTGLDVEIILTADGQGRARAFDKGDGVEFLNSSIGLNLENGVNLVSGDTTSDLAMVQKAASLNPDTRCLFVTTDTRLAEQAGKTCPDTAIFHYPDEMVLFLAEA